MDEAKDQQPPEKPLTTCPLCEGASAEEFLIAPDRFHWRQEKYTLLQCGLCSGVWLKDPPQPWEMGIHYDEDYHRDIMAAGEGSVESRWKGPRDLIARYKSGGSLLDVGCSSGAFLSTMQGAGWKLYGIEMEESTAQRAHARTGAEVFVGDVADAPFATESLDVVTSFDLIEHVYDPRDFLEKVMLWLKPGGIFVAMLPNIASWESSAFGSYWYGLELPRHLSHFSPRSLRHVMKAVGFEEAHLATPRISYIERSAGYVYSRVLEKAGIAPVPLAKRGQQNLAWRAVRKGLRLGMIAPFAQIASWAGEGPCMEVVFRKPEDKHAAAETFND